MFKLYYRVLIVDFQVTRTIVVREQTPAREPAPPSYMIFSCIVFWCMCWPIGLISVCLSSTYNKEKPQELLYYLSFRIMARALIKFIIYLKKVPTNSPYITQMIHCWVFFIFYSVSFSPLYLFIPFLFDWATWYQLSNHLNAGQLA